MKKYLGFMLALLLLCGCAPKAEKYEATFLSLFDTVSTVIGFDESEENFMQTAQDIHDELEEYHRLYDIYNTYEGINNLRTINDNAGVAPVEVDRKIIELLMFCRDMYYETDGAVNICMGSVLSLWSEARKSGMDDPENAALPDREALLNASQHTDISSLIIDEKNSTVYISDPLMRLDVGAVGKGYAVEKVTDNIPEGMVLSVGGNVSASGQKPGGQSWVVGVQDPFSEAGDHLFTVGINTQSVVSSGDYQRKYTVDGKEYHHIISPETLMPADKYSNVTVICEDSAYADVLSTALFILDESEGEKLLEKYGAEAVWVYNDGTQYFSKGFDVFLNEKQ
jgi:thiamine biosynthesis lipoprotein